MPRRAPGERVRCHAIAAGTYLAIVLFVLRAVLPDPSALLPFPAMLRATQWFRSNVLELDRQDQAMVVATVASAGSAATARGPRTPPRRPRWRRSR